MAGWLSGFLNFFSSSSSQELLKSGTQGSSKITEAIKSVAKTGTRHHAKVVSDGLRHGSSEAGKLMNSWRKINK